MKSKKLKGQTLRTLDQHKSFEIIEVDSNDLVILPRSTKISRPIRREGIETAYRYLITTGQLTIKEIEEEYTPRSQVYTAQFWLVWLTFIIHYALFDYG